ncbi:MAG: M1 family metallopeptidase [Isosphaeraceae bacterium]
MNRFLLRISIVLFGMLVWSPASSADTYPRQGGIDVLHYLFKLDLADASDVITGEATIEVRLVADGTTSVTLDLASPSSDKGMNVTGVTSSGKTCPHEHKESRLRVCLESTPKAGEHRSFTVSYRGVPRAGLRIGKNRHGERTFFSENWPDNARQWLPMVDHPYDKATSEFLVTAPARYQVISNGLLQEERDLGNGRRLTHWKQSVPIASWVNAIGVAEFAAHQAGLVKGVPLSSWVYPQDRERVATVLEAPARRSIEFYSERVGPFPFEKLANVQAAGLGGGMELASAIFYGERSVLGRDVDGLVAHEVAHQWFGDSVTERDWDDIWLSEGFATYFALLFLEHDRGRDAFVKGLKQSREIVFAVEKRNPQLAVIHDNVSDTRKILNGLVYQKGGWALHMLRKQIGTEAFWSGIRGYYERHRNANVTTEDFRQAMEASSGKTLGWFFQQWLKRPGTPTIEGHWQYQADAKRLDIDLSQSQAGEPYRLPIEVGIQLEGATEPRIETIEVTEKKQRFELKLDKPPQSVALDPDCWVLMKSRLEKRHDN